MSCEHTRELAPELALGIADGAERAQALDHLAGCADCRRAVAELSEVADELLMLSPRIEPPVGFESRVLAKLNVQPPAPRRRWWRRPLLTLAPAAAAAALAVVVVLGATAHDRQLAAQYRAALATAHGSYFEAARLQAAGRLSAGVAYGYRGSPSWIFVAVDPRYRRAPYSAELVMTSGRRVPLAKFRIDRVTGSAGQAIPVDLHDVSSIRLVGRTRGDVLEAKLPHARAR